MSNLSIKFSNPWFLLLLIPAIAFALLPYFRMNKRYRRTRNRITSIVLHLTVMTLAVTVLAGITFEYDTPNKDNEVILLVDTSDSGSENSDDKNDFVKSIIDNSDSMFKLGIVTFGYDQVYAVELSEANNETYTRYLQAPQPDNSATNISAALEYAASLFKNKKTARIVLLSDALETDGKEINTVIRSIASQGIKIDTVNFAPQEVGDEVQIVSMQMPNKKVNLGEVIEVTVTLQSSFDGTATITPYDNEKPGEAKEFELKSGIQTITVPYAFALPGLHNLSLTLESEDDTLALNNAYHTYVDIPVFDNILVIESLEGESQSLRTMIDESLKVTVVNVNDPIKMPKTLNELRKYDQIILCNISNDDIKYVTEKENEFADMLYSYVHDFGGGLFTICGNEEDSNPNDDEWTANAYTKEDMFGSTYQKLLPVEIINYTPPAAVVIIIDRSGSMYMPNSGEDYETSKLYYAKLGAESCLDALSERDFVGIMSLGDDYEEEIDLTPRTNRAKILAAIEGIEGGGNTEFYSALEHAGRVLGAKLGVEKKHIIIVTDGEPTDGTDDYMQQMKINAEKGITTSIVGIGCTLEARRDMIELLKQYAGGTEENFHYIPNELIHTTGEAMREDLMVPAIKDVNYVTFKPTFGTANIITAGIDESAMPDLHGFYGVKLKDGAEAIIMGQYTPIYSQWQLGAGTVGTFACDLNGVWSKDFIDSPIGEELINNIIRAIFPTQNIRPQDIDASVDGENYDSVVSVFADLADDEKIRLTVKSPALDGETEGLTQTFTVGKSDGYSRIPFTVKVPGVHEIIVEKLAYDDSVLASTTIYKALAYSKEYDLFRDLELAEALMTNIANTTDGQVIEDPIQVFENAVKYLHNVIDPKIFCIITALVLFLLDIAARKFKWKWPHEIIKDKRAKELMSKAERRRT